MISLATFHPATVHFPIAFLLVASVTGVIYLFDWAQLISRPNLRYFTWWAMLIGWIATGIAILSGLLAQSGLPPQSPYQNVLNWHIGTGLAIFLLYGSLLYWRWVRRTGRRRRGKQRQSSSRPDDLLDDRAARFWVAMLLLVGAGLVLASGWNGGRLVYEWGVNVATGS